MIEDMTVRNLSPAMQRSYVHAIAKLTVLWPLPPRRREALDVANILDQAIPVSQGVAAREMSGFEISIRKLVTHSKRSQ